MKKIVTLFFAAMLAGHAWSQTTFTIDNLKYTVTGDNTVSVEKGSTKPIGALDIPSTVTYPKTDGIPYTVTSFGYLAFDGCSGLTEVTIPNTVTNIGEWAFNQCSSLTSITIPNSVTSIGQYAFQSCTCLTSVTIPNSVTSIGDGAFHICGSLTSVTIPNSVTTIGNEAFARCSKLTEINVESGNTNYLSENGVLFNEAKTSLICYPVGKTETTYTIPNSVTGIGQYAFRGCIGLTSITIPESVTSIGEGAFRDCIGLTSVTIPISLTSIGTSVFNNCSSLTTVTIPNSVISIGDWAFIGCSGLISVAIPNSVTSIGDHAFQGCIGLKSITIPESVTSIGQYAFVNCQGLTSVVIPNSVTSLGNLAFDGCSSLTSVTIPNSLTSIGATVFRGCSGLTSVTIPNSVESIGSAAFYGCSGLTSICYEGSSEPTYQSNSFTNVDKTIPVCVPAEYSSSKWCGFTNLIKGHSSVTDNAVAATCTEIGLTEGLHCSYCGKVLVAQEEVAALGHDWGTPIYEWAEDGYACMAKIICQRNENHIVTENATITNDVTITATCEEMGTTTYTAKFTDSKFTTQTRAVVDIPALQHNYSTPTYTWSVDGKSCTATVVCQRDETHVVTKDATITSEETIAPTCEEMGTTTYTAVFENELFEMQTKDVVDILATGHTADSIEFENTIAATCTTVGSYDSVVYCSVCQVELFREEKGVAALGHTEVIDAAVPTTCTAAGKTGGKHCSVCDAVLVAQEEIAALGHTEVVDAAVPATCTTAGKTEGKHCSVCDAVLVAQEEIIALGHTEVVDAAVAATCTAAGKTEGKHCSVCNEIILAQTEIPALGHEFKDYIYNNDATTTADGTETATCTHGCGATDTRTAAGTKLAETPEKGTAVAESAANAVNIYAHGNKIVVENANDEIRVYDAMGKLVCRDAIHRVRAAIPVNTTGVYIVKTGNVAKHVMVN